MIQIDGTKRHVYLKFVDELCIQELLQWTEGRVENRHATGEISVSELNLQAWLCAVSE